MLEEILRHFLFVTMRWLHIVSVTLVVGGTLFFEFVVPIAIEDFKHEQQLAIFGRARWVFKRVVWVCAALLVASGTVSLYRMWSIYEAAGPMLLWPGAAHIALGILSILIAMSLTYSGRPPERPIVWMRINLAVLLLAILAANIVRHNRVTLLTQPAQHPTTQSAEPGPPAEP